MSPVTVGNISPVHHKSCFQEHKNTKCHLGLALSTRGSDVFGNCFCFVDTSSIYQIVFASVNESRGQDWLEQVEPARRTGLTILQQRLAFPPPYYAFENEKNKPDNFVLLLTHL